MKKSSIMLLGGAGFIFLILLTIVIFLRVKVNDLVQDRGSVEKIEYSGEMETLEYDFEDFNRLTFDDMWDVKIKRGDQYSVKINTDKALIDYIDVEQKGSLLIFSLKNYLSLNQVNSKYLFVEIIMPDLEKIACTGMGQIEIEDMKMKNLEISNSGAVNLLAENSTVENLKLNISGAANASLNDLAARNCDLNISGAASISLTMTGGFLEGRISGAANVSYSGTVSEERVSISGIGTLNRQ